MSTIFLDPVQMDATAGHIGEHVNELTTLTADLETACSAAVPASIAGWLAEELRDIALTARMIALLYSVAALDTAQRAQQIQADQSLATAAPSLAATSPAFTGAPLVGGFGAFASTTAGTGSTGSMVLGGAGGYLPLDSTSISSGSSGSMVLGGPGVYLPLDSTKISSGSSGSMVLGGFEVFVSGPNTPLGGATGGFSGGSSNLPLGLSNHHDGNLWTLSDEAKGVTWVEGNTYTHGGARGTFDQVRPDPEHE